jgi:hypothetical protein
LILGAPAVGKKLARDEAQALNPIFQEAHPSKVTLAGISSTSYFNNGSWRSAPGYLPRAHQGLCAVQFKTKHPKALFC